MRSKVPHPPFLFLFWASHLPLRCRPSYWVSPPWEQLHNVPVTWPEHRSAVSGIKVHAQEMNWGFCGDPSVCRSPLLGLIIVEVLNRCSTEQRCWIKSATSSLGNAENGTTRWTVVWPGYTNNQLQLNKYNLKKIAGRMERYMLLSWGGGGKKLSMQPRGQQALVQVETVNTDALKMEMHLQQQQKGQESSTSARGPLWLYLRLSGKKTKISAETQWPELPCSLCRNQDSDALQQNETVPCRLQSLAAAPRLGFFCQSLLDWRKKKFPFLFIP